MISPQIILWLFLIVLPISAFVWSFLLIYPWRYFRPYVIGHIASIPIYCVIVRLFPYSESDLDGVRATFFLVVAGYSHCLLGTLTAFVIRKKYLQYA